MTRSVALITGASSGIGRAAALAFVRAGFHVCGLARRGGRLADLEAEIAGLPEPRGQFLALTGDVRHADDMDEAARRTVERFGGLDVLLANAGIGYSGALVDADWDDLDQVMRTNIDGALHAIRACVPVMRRGGGGHILIVSSVVAGVHTPYTAVYAASKAFVSSLAGALRLEIERDNIAVTDLLVGRTATEFSQNRLGPLRTSLSGLPTKSAEDVAEAMLLCLRRKRERVALSLFDRLILLGGAALPGTMARLAKKQYAPDD